MSLVKFDGKSHDGSNSQRKITRHRLPEETKEPLIDYAKLKELCDLDGLQSRQNAASSEDAHKQFMDLYPSIFASSQPKASSGLPTHTEARSKRWEELRGSDQSVTERSSLSVGGNTLPDNKLAMKKTYPVDSITHDVRDYLPLLHKERKSENPQAVRAERVRTLRKILKKLPFERTAAENDQVFKILRTIPPLAYQVPSQVLKELCVAAQLDAWKDPDVTVFGNTGFHVIIKGAVQPQAFPYLKTNDMEEVDFRTPTPELDEDLEELRVGDCFGTLQKVEGRDANSKILTVVTMEPNCEFMKITTSDYTRVIEQIRQRDQTEKVNLLQSKESFKLWSRQPLLKVANLMEWTSFAPNTVLVSEGYKAPFIGFIKTGECHVLRQVEVLQPLPSGKKEKRTKQVVMGKLRTTDSFGEISVLGNEPITCSIVTAKPVELGIIYPESLHDLDDITKQLLQQSSEATYGGLSKEDIHEEYVEQELKREWNSFKHGVVVDVINNRGIRPGYGKWTK